MPLTNTVRKGRIANHINSMDLEQRKLMATLIEYGGGGVLWTQDITLNSKSMIHTNSSVLNWLEDILKIISEL